MPESPENYFKQRLAFLKGLQPDFEVAAMNSKTGEPCSWVSINKADPQGIKFREFLGNEIILDFDRPVAEENRKWYEEKKPLLLKAGLSFDAWTTHSKSTQVHIFFDKPLTNEQRQQIVNAIFSKEEQAETWTDNKGEEHLSLDPSFWTKSRQLIALEWIEHYRSGKPKEMIESFGEGLNTFSETKMLLLKRNPSEKERCKVFGNIIEYNNFNEEQACDYIDKNNEWGDYDKEITRKKCAALYKGLKAKQNPNRPEQEKKVATKKASFNPFKAAIAQQVNWLSFADRFVKDVGVHYDRAKLWWLWDKVKTAWVMVDETDIMNLVDEALSNQPQTIQSKIKDQILESLKRAGRKNKPEQPKQSWLQFKNKVVDVETAETFESTPKYFFTNPINWELGDSEETATMDKLFKEWVGEKQTESLFEIIAYCLSSAYFIHIIVCLTGGGSNGKSTYLKIVNKFIGAHNITSTDLDILINSRFEIAKLFKKLVATMGETNFSTMRRTSLLKRLVGEDLVGGEFKNKAPFDFCNYAKILIATNTLPVSEDRTRGFYRRWFLIDFPNEFPPDRDVFAEIPDTEYKNLARKCVNLLKKLRQQRRFTLEPNIDTKTREYEDRSNPITAFIKEKFVREVDAKVPFFEFYEAYCVYLAERRFRTQSKKEVSAIIEQEGFETRKCTVRKADETETVWLYVFGLRFKRGLEGFDEQRGGVNNGG